MLWPIFYPTSYFDCSWHYGESWVFVGAPMGSVVGSKALLFQLPLMTMRSITDR